MIQTLSLEFLALIFLCYLAATFSFSFYLRNLSRVMMRLARWFLAIGLLLHFGELITLLRASGEFVPTSSYLSVLTITALTAAMCFILSFRRSKLLVIVILLPLISAGLLSLHFVSGAEVLSRPPSPWLWTHILSTLMGEVLFCFAAAASAVYLLAESRLKNREVSGFLTRLPSLPDIDSFLQELLLGGFYLLSLGMLLGFFFAREYWSAGWILDPKVLFCLLTWVGFAIILILRGALKNFRGRLSAKATIAGFICILFLSFGIDFIFPSQHPNVGIERLQP
jgi:ABC-type uncharacterized transport system permease subunit